MSRPARALGIPAQKVMDHSPQLRGNAGFGNIRLPMRLFVVTLRFSHMGHFSFSPRLDPDILPRCG